METFQRRRSKITSFAGDLLASAEPIFREGNRHHQKRRSFPKLAADSSSCDSATTDDDSLTFEVGWRSSKQAVRRPMKKLLAEEMSKQNESKRLAPSVIARLMGLDGLPPQQPTLKQHRRFAENYQQKVPSVEKTQRSGTSSGCRSFRKSSKEEQEFKDVFEVLDTSKMESSSNSVQETSNAKFTEAEMVFIRQKFMDAKRLSTDERLQDSKEFHDALEVLESNKDLLLDFFQQPDSLYTKHLHDLGTSPQPHCAHMSAMTSSHDWKCESSGFHVKAERKTPWKNHCKSSHKNLDNIPGHSYSKNPAAQSLHMSTKSQLEEKEDFTVFPTRIVVLKPNLGKSQNVTRTVPSPRSSHAYLSDCRKKTELPGVKNREAESWKRIIPNDVGISRHKSRESREIAKEITSQMRNSFRNGSGSGFKGYAGDESSSNMSGSDSANESDSKTVASRDEFDRHCRFRSSSSHSTESAVSREAKKRLSERWKMSHKSEDLGVISRGSTLGEMLAIPDREVRPENLDAVVGEEGFSDTFGSNNGPGGFVEPLGISSRDGWKDSCVGKLSRSRSLPASSSFGSPKSRLRREAFRDDRYMMPKETVKRERNKAVKGNVNHMDGSSCKTSKSSCKKSLSSRSTSRESIDWSPDIHSAHCQFGSQLKYDDQSEHSFMVSTTSENIATDSSSVPEKVLDVGHENPNLSLESPNSAPLLLKSDSSAGDSDILSSKEPSDIPTKEVPFQHPGPELESPASSKEADQPSPVSILEAPFTDDLACGSEYFEGVSADLHGLRMQLQLLKLESDTYAEGTMLVSSDEDAEESSIGFIDQKSILKPEDNWESSYVADMLIESGCNDINPDTFFAICHSPDCPVNPSIFEELEKKYCNVTSWTKSERKLTFDSINANLVEVYEQLADHHAWMRPKWKKNILQDNLQKLLTSQPKKVSKDAGEKVLGRESQWLDIRGDVDEIGREIERLLIDELVAEVVVM